MPASETVTPGERSVESCAGRTREGWSCKRQRHPETAPFCRVHAWVLVPNLRDRLAAYESLAARVTSEMLALAEDGDRDMVEGGIVVDSTWSILDDLRALHEGKN